MAALSWNPFREHVAPVQHCFRPKFTTSGEEASTLKLQWDFPSGGGCLFDSAPSPQMLADYYQKLKPAENAKAVRWHIISEKVRSTECPDVDEISSTLLIPFSRVLRVHASCVSLAEIEDRRALEFESKRNGDRPLTFSARRDRVSIVVALRDELFSP